MDVFLWIAGIVVVMLIIFVPVVIRSRQVNLTGRTEEIPEWMHSAPPDETIAATTADGEGVMLYDYDDGEKLASPFAEQIEDILRAQLQNDPALQSFTVDFGTAPDGTLEIWVNAEKYTSIDQLPGEPLKKAFREAVQKWNKK
jgi:hypothetical protein